MSLGGRPCALGPRKPLTPAGPMGWMRRLEHYQDHNGRKSGELTPVQRRRFSKKLRQARRREQGGAS